MDKRRQNTEKDILGVIFLRKYLYSFQNPPSRIRMTAIYPDAIRLKIKIMASKSR